MRDFDEQEKLIVRELIRNPRLSDNQIGKHTGIPVKTVNRKRKILENEHILHYMVLVNHGREGTGIFNAQHLYLVKFNYGITTAKISEVFPHMFSTPIMNKHVLVSGLGEEDGRVTMMLILESAKHSDIIEIFNAEIVPAFTQAFGSNPVHSVQSMPMRRKSKLFHNYIPDFNMEKGIIKKDWPNEKLFIS